MSKELHIKSRRLLVTIEKQGMYDLEAGYVWSISRLLVI